jgi:hypothetical protein
MATTATYNLPTQKTGSTFNELPLQINLGGTAVNITSFAFKLQFRRQVNGNAELTFELGSGISLVDAVNGQLKIETFLITLPPAKYVWDLRVTDANGNIDYPIGGAWEILPNVSR